MKKLGRTMALFLSISLLAVLGLMAFIRLAPVDVALWDIDLQSARPADMRFVLVPPGRDLVQTLARGAYADLYADPDAAAQILAKLDQIALATPRTTRLAGDVGQGRITWQTRSAFWGFPDYTTAQITPAGLTLYARLRFGRSDFGVNAARLRHWLAQL
jgi:uncharacterized protein (DUF1499 family)